jgi:hypothetical protein
MAAREQCDGRYGNVTENTVMVNIWTWAILLQQSPKLFLFALLEEDVNCSLINE